MLVRRTLSRTCVRTAFNHVVHENEQSNQFEGFSIPCCLQFNNKTAPRRMSVFGRSPTVRQFQVADRWTRSQQK